MNKVSTAVMLMAFPVLMMAQQQVRIIPQPNEVQVNAGSFLFSNCTRIRTDSALQDAVLPLLTKLKTAAGIDPGSSNDCNVKSEIAATIDKNMADDESYKLVITPGKIVLRAGGAAGVFYGMQSILQLLPPAIEMSTVQQGIKWTVPCVVINDKPRFSYRGIMLDVARHYMPFGFLKKMVDLLAMQKMNRLHIHLTDTQG